MGKCAACGLEIDSGEPQDYRGPHSTHRADTFGCVTHLKRQIDELKAKQMPSTVLELWEVTLESLGPFGTSEKTAEERFKMRFAFEQHLPAAEVVKVAKNRFNAEWWERYLIVSVNRIGDLHGINTIPLYEEGE